MNRWVRIGVGICDLGLLLFLGTGVQMVLAEAGPDAEFLHVQLAWFATLVGWFGWSWVAFYSRSLRRELERQAGLAIVSLQSISLLAIVTRWAISAGVVLVGFFVFSAAFYKAGIPVWVHLCLSSFVLGYLLMARLVVGRRFGSLAMDEIPEF